jgi:transaldolase
MSLYLDSALVEDARQAFSTGFVHGITTNPKLLAQTKRPAEEVIPELCDLSTGIVFHQLAAEEYSERKNEAILIAGLRPGRIGLKIPCTFENLALAAELVKMGHVVSITAIFSSQRSILPQAGAQPSYHQSQRNLLGDGMPWCAR